MRGDLTLRTVKTASGAKAVQIIRYESGKRIVVKHVGSAHTDDELKILEQKAEELREALCVQPSLFPAEISSSRLLHADHLYLSTISHRFAYEALRRCLDKCGLGELHDVYKDLALMRIIEPSSKIRTLELLQRYFGVSHSERTAYRLLPKLITYKERIEKAAYETAKNHFDERFALVLYDVTTLYFESHEPDDELLARGFSKDDKSKQPQIVIGLLVTTQGFPLMHEVYKGNTFEGHTMLSVIQKFQLQPAGSKPIIVADAAMLSKDNMKELGEAGYQYIVGARLANTSQSFIKTLDNKLLRQDGAMARLSYPKVDYEVVCSYSDQRYKKDKWQFEKQVAKAKSLLESQEPGKRAKFVKKSDKNAKLFIFDEILREKTEILLGVKGYCTNIPEETLSNKQVIAYYHELWHVEQTFRMSKTDLRARPIFHYEHEAVKAHVLLCFIGLMMGKFLELKTKISLRRIRDILWNVHEVHLEDSLTGQKIKLQTNLSEYEASGLHEVLKPH